MLLLAGRAALAVHDPLGRPAHRRRYLVAREGTRSWTAGPPIVGALLLLAAELALWSIEHDARIQAEPTLVVRRIATLRLLVWARCWSTSCCSARRRSPPPPGVVLAAAGVAAAVAAVAVVLRLVRA